MGTLGGMDEEDRGSEKPGGDDDLGLGLVLSRRLNTAIGREATCIVSRAV